MIFKLAWRNIWRNKRRTFITLASVFFAVILSTLMMSLKEGVYEKMIDSSVGDFLGYGQIHLNGYWEEQNINNVMPISGELEDLIENTKGIDGYAPRIENYGLIATENKTKGSLVVGIDPDKENEFSELSGRVIEGEYLDEDDSQALIGNGLAEYLNVGVGDTIVVVGQGFQEASAAGKYRIKGIVKFGSPELSKQLIFLPLIEAQILFDAPDLYSSLILLINHPKTGLTTVTNIRQQLPEEYEVLSWEEMSPDLINMIETDRVEGYVFMFILYMVITFGMFGTTLMMLSERKREFGVLVAIGMNKIRLSIIVFIELLMIAILGAFLGVFGAYPVCYYFYKNPIQFGDELAEMTEEFGIEAVLQASLAPSIFIQQAIIVAMIAIFIGVFPFVKLNRLNIIEAMRK